MLATFQSPGVSSELNELVNVPANSLVSLSTFLEIWIFVWPWFLRLSNHFSNTTTVTDLNNNRKNLSPSKANSRPLHRKDKHNTCFIFILFLPHTIKKDLHSLVLAPCTVNLLCVGKD